MTGSYFEQFLGQEANADNTQQVTSSDASPGSPWVGSWTETRALGVVRVLTVLAGTVANIPGTFTFEFTDSDDPDTDHPTLGTAEISEERTIATFNTVRDFDLLNAGAYYRVAFEPDNALASESVFVTTTLRYQNDGAFVRLGDQQLEKANAALPSTFSYVKGFDSDGVSVDIPAPHSLSENSTTTVPTTGTPFAGTGVDVNGHSFITVSILYEASGAHTGTLFLEFSEDNTNWVAVDGGIAVEVAATAGSFARFPPRTLTVINTYFRVRYVPDDNNLTSFHLNSRVSPYQNAKLTGRLSQSISGSEDVEVVRAVIAGRQPDGDFVNARATGLARDINGVDVETTAALGASASYQSGWIDSDGWDGFSVTIKTDQVSAGDGVLVEYTNDVDSPTVIDTRKRTFGAAQVANGSATFRFGPVGDGFRVTYTNGGTPQGSFYLGVTMHEDVTELPRGPVEGAVNDASEAVMGRNAIMASDSGTGTWSNIEQTSSGLQTYTMGQDYETPIKSLGSFKVTRATVSTTAALVFTPDANCRSWIAKAVISGNNIIYIAETLVKASSGSGYPMDDRDIIGGDLEGGSGPVYAVSSSGTQALAFFETLE